MEDMPPIPTQPVWIVVKEDTSGHTTLWERFDTEQEATDFLSGQSTAPECKARVIRYDWPVPDRTLPNDEQRRLLCDFLHRAFVVIRQWGYENKSELIGELADILHNLPQEMFIPDRWDWNSIEFAIREFTEKYPDEQTLGLARTFHMIRNKS